MTAHARRRRGAHARTAALVLLLLTWGVPARAMAILPTFTGTSAEHETLVLAAMGWWESTILDPFTVAIDVALVSLPGDTLARALDFVPAADGRPSSARIEIDDRVGDLGWFVDPTPFDGSEFSGSGLRTVADPAGPAWLLFDLLSVVNHELAHALGFTINYAEFAAHVVDDPVEGRKYVGAGLDVHLAAAGTHLHNAFYTEDLMSELFGINERRLVSALDVRILADAFGYDAVIPVDPDPIPEPTLTALFSLAGVAMLVRGRRRR
jgi:MYXO-CTERM domain-containing protein